MDFETLVKGEDLLQLLEAGEAAGSIRASELADVLEAHGYDALEIDAVYRELERLSIDVIEDDQGSVAAPPHRPGRDDDRRAAALSP